jgi:hypothetical protein
METTLEYYLGIDVSSLSDEMLVAKFELVNQIRAKEKDHSMADMLKLLKSK